MCVDSIIVFFLSRHHRITILQQAQYSSNRSTHSTQTLPRPKYQPKVIQNSNVDFRINLNPDPEVYRIAPKMYWIHFLVGMSHFTKFRNNQPVTMRNGKKSPKIL